MTTFSILEDASVAASGVAGSVITKIRDQILDAAEIWNRYLTQGSFDIKIELVFEDITGSALATGGSSFHFSGSDGPGQEIWKIDSAEEYITGAEFDSGGDTIDITLTIDTPTILAGDFYYDPDPFLRIATIPGDKTDFISLILHEIGHGLGFLGSVAGEPGSIDDEGPDITPFDDNVDLVSGDRFWTGAFGMAAFGGAIPLDPGSLSHIADSGDGGFENLMDPSILDGTRMFVLPVHVGMLQDMGLPVRAPSIGADTLYGFDGHADDVDLLAGADFFDGLGGADLVDAGAGADTARGGEGDDTLFGGTEGDSLFGDGGADSVRGADGADTVIGGGFDDTIEGGLGDDTAAGEAGRDSLFGDEGADTLHGFGSHDTCTGGAGDDDLRGGFGKDLLNGAADDDVARGFEGDDRLFGGGGVDTLLGGDENDSLIGGGGGDRLKGDAGDDSLNGSFGADLVTGGLGDDEFQFRKTHGADTIDDFVAGAATDDVIRLLVFGAAFDSFGEVIAAASDDGTDTTIDFGAGDMLILKGVLVGELHADDFRFG